MIISQTPLRISFVGGGSDIRDYWSNSAGSVISSTIDKYIYVIVKGRFDNDIYLNYSNKEIVSSLNDIKWTKEGAADSDYSSNSYVLVFAIEVDNTILVNTPHLTGGVVSGFSTVQLIANTNTDVIPAVYSGTFKPPLESDIE